MLPFYQLHVDDESAIFQDGKKIKLDSSYSWERWTVHDDADIDFAQCNHALAARNSWEGWPCHHLFHYNGGGIDIDVVVFVMSDFVIDREHEQCEKVQSYNEHINMAAHARDIYIQFCDGFPPTSDQLFN